MDTISIWILKPALEKLLDVGILLGALIIATYVGLRFILTLKNSGATIQIGKKDGSNLTIAQKTGSTSVSPDWVRSAFEDLYKDVKEIESSRAETESLVPLVHHIVFFNLKKIEEKGVFFSIEDIDSMSPSESIKTKYLLSQMFIRRCIAPVFSTGLKTFVKEVVSEPDKELKNDILYSINDRIFEWIGEYYEKAKNMRVYLPIRKKYLPGVPSLYLKKFDSWHSLHVSLLLSKIQSILHSDFYKSWQLKLILLLDMIDICFYLTVEDSKRTIETLDGELDREIDAILEAFTQEP